MSVDGEDRAQGVRGNVVAAPLPERILNAIVGCWTLEQREQWTISRTERGGARVVRKLLGAAVHTDRLGYSERAAVPCEIMYDAAEGTLAFSTAGPVHALLFVFKPTERGLEGSWASSHAPGEKYTVSATGVLLRRCSND